MSNKSKSKPAPVVAPVAEVVAPEVVAPVAEVVAPEATEVACAEAVDTHSAVLFGMVSEVSGLFTPKAEVILARETAITDLLDRKTLTKADGTKYTCTVGTVGVYRGKMYPATITRDLLTASEAVKSIDDATPEAYPGFKSLLLLVTRAGNSAGVVWPATKKKAAPAPKAPEASKAPVVSEVTPDALPLADPITARDQILRSVAYLMINATTNDCAMLAQLAEDIGTIRRRVDIDYRAKSDAFRAARKAAKEAAREAAAAKVAVK